MIKLKNILTEGFEISNHLHIDKIEEHRSFEFYKRHFLSKDIQKYNSQIGEGGKYHNLNIKEVSERDVIMKMKKTGHYPSRGGFSDRIDYIAVMESLPNVGDIRFWVEIYKHAGKLFVRHGTSLAGAEFVDTIVETEEKGEQNLTKMEEQYAYNYLIKQILPQSIKDTYYKFIEKYPDRYPERRFPRITVRDISRNIKKIRTDIDRVEYESVINDHVSFNFKIVKEWHMDGYINGKENWNLFLLAGVEGPMGSDWKWYDIKYQSSRITESISEYKPLTKMEEMYALEFIRKKILPDIVDYMNDVSRGYTHTPIVNVDTFRKTLKKIKVNADWIEYKAVHPHTGESFKFLIFKNSRGVVFIRRTDDGTTREIKQ